MTDQNNKHQIRRLIRAKRKALSKLELGAAALAIARNARSSNKLLKAKNILSYAPFAGEISPSSLVNNLAVERIFLPRITNFRQCLMHFYSADHVNTLNKYGILEPQANGSPWPANTFDVILVPLVAFDRNGSRLGMGAGYYDRALASLKYQTSTKPYLVGLAHHFQEVKSLEPAPWDVPLDAILTDQEFISI